MGRYWTQVNEENWVARWYLWHSFRYSFTMIQRATIIEGDRRKLSACGRGDFRRQKQFHLRRHLLL
ncbi:unnamed protein product [Alternaria sp. RS040]